ncbi:DUF4144 family protein [Neptuniibacter sp. QD34_54]|uniref:DUF4144 family protein n=1 Tax=Neptuniibacter sp. QD34_54 TaxID=3398208 RepID=UPI0039F629A3
MIKWPAIIKYQGDNELIYIASGSVWETDQDLHAVVYDADDRLIDSDGVLFSLEEREDRLVILRPVEACFELEEMVDLIRAHFSSIGECCVSKFSIGSIAEGITTVGQFEER